MGATGLMIAGAVVALPGLVLAAIAFFSRKPSTKRYRLLLIGSITLALAVFPAVTGWLLMDPGTSKGDALKTGGLASGAILALYALWINDRRRRTEEARHEVERIRAQQDKDRIDDERFAKAVELLGNDADQVRVGAMHALAGLARARPAYTQTVLDVLCAYLRRPFTHPIYELKPATPGDEVDGWPSSWTADQIADADREQQVRLTAQRLIAGLLPKTAEDGSYDLDLTGASLEFLTLSNRHIGELIARRTQFYGSARFDGMHVHQIALFSNAVFHGRLDLGNARFEGGLSLLNAQVKNLWRVPGAVVGVVLDLRAEAPAEQVGELTVLDGTRLKVEDHHNWAIQLAATQR